ncbi:hypothetical protein LA080_008135 [Diaporthe eres]|nr:hypothetical protein LA080_008135 [Diaporthe eres]
MIVSNLANITWPTCPGQPFIKLSLTPTDLHLSAPDEAAIATQEPRASSPPRRTTLSNRQRTITSGVDGSSSRSRSGSSLPGRTPLRSATTPWPCSRSGGNSQMADGTVATQVGWLPVMVKPHYLLYHHTSVTR